MDPTTIDALGKYFQIDPVTLGLFPLIAITLASLLKEQVGLRGRAILLAVAVTCGFLSWYANRPAIDRILIGAVIYFIIAAGGWASAKRLFKKPVEHLLSAGGATNEKTDNVSVAGYRPGRHPGDDSRE